MKNLPSRSARLIFALISIALAACSSLFSFTAERAAVAEVLEAGSPGEEILPESVQVLQSREWDEEKLVLIFFQALDSDQRRSKCLFMYEMQQGPAGWEGPGWGGCGLAINSRERFQGLSYESAIVDDPGSSPSYVYALIPEQKVSSVQIIWNDGESQLEEVVNGSILALRQEAVEPEELVGLDTEGQVVYTYDPP